MHTLLTLLGVLLVILGCYATLGILRRFETWSSRRDLQFWVLTVPFISLGLGLGALYHFANRDCFFSAPTWDYAIAIGLPVVMSVVALGGLGMGLVRLAFLHWFITRRGLQAAPELERLMSLQADQLGVSCPRLFMCVYNRPLALTYGLRQPTLLLSTWMIRRLDRRELEAVIAHELAHVMRHDSRIIWLATMLRDAFFYLPTGWIAYRQFQHEKEFACDDLAIELTHRPLALASALAKVWQALVSEPTFGVAQSLTGTNHLIEQRIERLMVVTKPVADESGAPLNSLKVTTLALVGLFAVEALSAALILALMGCGPLTFIARLLGTAG